VKLIRLFCTVLAILFQLIIYAQPTIAWQKSIGGPDWDQASCIETTPDGGYIVAGFTSSAGGDVSQHVHAADAWIVKLSKDGNIEWEKSFGGIGNQMPHSIQVTKDGGFIIAGQTNERNLSNDVWIVKISAIGELQWEKIYGSYGDEGAQSIIQTTDGGYVFVGSSSGKYNGGDVEEGFGSYDGWMGKLDNNGNLLWQKVLGGSSGDVFTSIKQTKEGGFILAGSSSSAGGDFAGNHGNTDYWIVKLTSAGNLEWQKLLGGWFEDHAWDIEITTEGGFIVAGAANGKSGDISGNKGWLDEWIVKLSSTGVIEWDKNFGGGFDDTATDILLTPDGGYVVAGRAGSTDGNLTAHHGTIYFDDYWVTKLDGAGNLEWQKSMGGTGEDWAYGITLASDEGYVVAGHNGSNDGEITGNQGGRDFWIVKLVDGTCYPKISIKTSATTICTGTPVTFTASIQFGGNSPSFQWLKNGNSVGTNSQTYTDNNLLPSDIITCKLTSNEACAKIVTVTSNAITLSMDIASDIPVVKAGNNSICKGTSTILTIEKGSLNGASEWKWYENSCDGTSVGNGTSITVNPTSTTTYYARGEGNCVNPGSCASITIIVNEPATPSIQISADPSGPVCPGKAITFTATVVNAGTAPVYEWTRNGMLAGNNAPTFTSNAFNNNDLVTCRLTSSASCVTQSTASSNSIAVELYSMPVGIVFPAFATVCTGAYQQFEANGGSSYQWMLNGAPIPGATANSFRATEEGLYSVMISDGNCESPAANSATLDLRPLPAGNISPAAGAICEGQSIMLKATAGFGYQWYLNNEAIPGADAQNYLATNPGDYQVVLSDDHCSGNASNTAAISPAVLQKGKHEIVRVASNMPFSLRARNAGQNYLWTPVTGLDNPSKINPVVTTSQDRTYTVAISSPAQCPVIDTVEVQVFSKPAFYVPTGFTPDGDGLNDYLMPIPVHFKEINYFKVFNRWGEIVFQTSKVGYGWNGYHKGIPQQSDVYIWMLEAKDINGKLISEKGTCTLVR
jgi:gliding motility-associated-like protein